MATNFPASMSDILTRPDENITRPKPIPVGTYTGLIPSPAEKPIEFKVAKSENKTPFASIHVRLISPLDTVDPVAFQEAGGIERLAKVNLTYDLWLTDDSAWRAKEFLVNMQCDGRNLSERLQKLPGKRVLVQIKHDIYKEEPIAKIESMVLAPA